MFIIYRTSIFERFVTALLNDDYNIQWDIHNLALHLKCDVCNIPYNVIGKQETEYEVCIKINRYKVRVWENTANRKKCSEKYLCNTGISGACVLDVSIFSLDISHLRATEVFFGIWYCDFNEQKNFNKNFNKIWHSAFFPNDTKSLQWPL